MNRSFVIALSGLVCACAPRADDEAATEADQPAAATTPAAATEPGSFTRAQFAELRWLEGDWRGSMPNGQPFFERYRVTSDSTIQMHAFADSTMTQATDSSRVYWRDNRIYSGSESVRSVVARIDSAGVHFVPDGSSGYHYTWKQTGDGWTATLNPADPARRVVYEMRRVR